MDAIENPVEAARHAIAVLGGPSAAAKRLNVKGHRHQTVQSWLRNRVPAEYCPRIEQETQRSGDIVVCERLRPDVPWGVLRGPAAQALTTATPQPQEVSHVE